MHGEGDRRGLLRLCELISTVWANSSLVRLRVLVFRSWMGRTNSG